MAPRQWALVTGVSENGMGEGEVFAFLERGVNVIATSLDLKVLEYLKDAAEKYRKFGASLVHQELDVTSPESIRNAVDRLRHITGGRLDFLMNNAGYGYYMPLIDVDLEQARKEYEVNVWGVVAVTQAFFPMLRDAKGTIVLQSSVSAVQGFNRPFMGIYSSSKAAIASIGDCMRVELAPFDVKVVTLMTGSVKTEFFQNKVGGRQTTLPSSSPYNPIRQQVETMMNGSLSGTAGHDRLTVTRSTIAMLMARHGWMKTRYIRRGYAAIKLWLIHMLFPVWLIDRWAKQAGSLDKLGQMLRSRRGDRLQ